MPHGYVRKDLTMSDVRAVRGSAEANIPPEAHPAPKRDAAEQRRSRRSRPSKPTDVEISEPEAHQLDVEA
jgi:hypothetical protein